MSTTQPPFYDEGVSAAYGFYLADGTTLDPVTQILMGHTGTLDTTTRGGLDRVAQRPGTADDIDLGLDGSAASINPALRPDLTVLPAGYHAGPTFTAPIY